MKLFYKIVNKVTNFGKAKEVFNKNRKFGSYYKYTTFSDNNQQSNHGQNSAI